MGAKITKKQNALYRSRNIEKCSFYVGRGRLNPSSQTVKTKIQETQSVSYFTLCAKIAVYCILKEFFFVYKIEKDLFRLNLLLCLHLLLFICRYRGLSSGPETYFVYIFYYTEILGHYLITKPDNS